MSMLSVVLPSYNEEAMIKRTAKVMASVLEREWIEYELVFVDDGSSDSTWEEIRHAARDNAKVHGVHFSRNFGKESAIFAGLASAKGDCVAVMDCDLQHPPQTVVEMYRLWEQGYEVIEGVKRSRGDESLFHRMSAITFYRWMSMAAKMDMTHASDFKLLDRKVVDVLLAMPEKNAFFRALSGWVGFRTISVEFDVQEREAGVSKWTTRSLIRYGVSNIAGFTSLPLHLILWIGGFALLAAFILGLQTIVRYCMGKAVEGFTTVILLILLMGSLIMISLGVIGYYIARIYEEVKGRPRYIISATI
ncbi:MAG: glycosyltransferase family 2 protein [Blautia sp.]|nr:glycosyltransferase family 2 protein [Blautia sp.]